MIELESGVRWERMTAWDDPDVEFMIAVYGVGGSSSADGELMRHTGREFGLVLSGTLSVTVGFDDYVLERRRLDHLRVDDAPPAAQRRRRRGPRDLGHARPLRRRAAISTEHMATR